MTAILKAYLAGIPNYPDPFSDDWGELQLVVAESQEEAARLAYPNFSHGRIADVLAGDDDYEVRRYEAGDAVATGEPRVIRDLATMRAAGLHFNDEDECECCGEWSDDVCPDCCQCPVCAREEDEACLYCG